jgi:hypothetical protein
MFVELGLVSPEFRFQIKAKQAACPKEDIKSGSVTSVSHWADCDLCGPAEIIWLI